MINQLLPIVYVRNNTDATIENVYFSYDNIELMGSKVKRIKPNITKNISLYLADRQKFQLQRDDYDLIMHYGDKHHHIIYEGYGISPSYNILVEIMSIYNDGSLGIKVDEKYCRI